MFRSNKSQPPSYQLTNYVIILRSKVTSKLTLDGTIFFLYFLMVKTRLNAFLADFVYVLSIKNLYNNYIIEMIMQ